MNASRDLDQSIFKPRLTKIFIPNDKFILMCKDKWIGFLIKDLNSNKSKYPNHNMEIPSEGRGGGF